jgi:XapX domain-containing protein
MKILIAFVVAFGIGAASRWTRVPSLAPQAIVGSLLIVAMSTGWIAADRLLTQKQPMAVAHVSRSEGAGVPTNHAVPLDTKTGPRVAEDVLLERKRH